MRSIRISDEVWQEIAKRGKFGETEDDVLKRVFKIRPHGSNQDGELPQPNARASIRGGFATDKMHAKVYRQGNGSYLKVRFHGSGQEQNFDLPKDRSDKQALRRALEGALAFGEKNGASKGQLFAIRKALTDEGYHLTK
jgi:hypothetical protein